MTGRRYLVTRSSVDDDGRPVIDHAEVLDLAALIDAARRVCPLDHLHDTAAEAEACTAPPTSSDE